VDVTLLMEFSYENTIKKDAKVFKKSLKAATALKNNAFVA
jgi:hypothetical protein